MAISNAYPKGIPVEDADLFVGSKAYTNRTVNYTAQGIADYLNINAKVSIGGQMTFKFSVVPNMPKTIAFEGGFGDNTPFADITRLVVSGSDGSGSDITIFLDYLVDSKILLAQQNQPNNFGHYKILSYTQIGITDFYNLDLEYIGGNGNIVDEIYYDMVSFSLGAGSGGSQNLQQVTDIGSTTTNTITAAALVAGNFTSDGYTTYISDAYDSFGNFNYLPYYGLTITDGYSSINITQDNSITFTNNSGGTGNLRTDNLTALAGLNVWQLPNASGTIALTSDIPAPPTPLDLQTTTDNGKTTTNDMSVLGAGTEKTYIGKDQILSTSNFFNYTIGLDRTTSVPYFYINQNSKRFELKVNASQPTGTIVLSAPTASGTLALLSDIPSYSVPTLDDVLQAGNVTQRGMQIKFINWFSLLGGYAQLNGELCTTGNSPIYQFQNKATGSYQLATLDDIPTGGGTVTSVNLTMPAAFTVSGNPITSSGTLAVTAAGSASQYVRGDGQLATLPSNASGGSAISYYLNGGTAASVATYYQMSKTAVVGTGVDFSLAGNGLISQWLTDVADPNRLEIPAGNWNFEMYMSASSAGGTPAFYVELLKYDGVTFTTIANSSAVPEAITGGTLIDLYLTSLAIPYTTLTIADRLAIRVYIVNSTGGRTITMHTQDSQLCQIITNFAGGIAALNGLVANTQYLAVGTSGTDFAISSITDTHTFNLPTASATNRGALSSADWSTFNGKETALTFSTGLTRTTNTITSNLSTGIAGGQSIIGGTASGNSLTLSSTSNATKGKLLFGTSAYDEVNNRLGITQTTPTSKIHITTNALGSGALVDSSGLLLENSTLSTAGTYQNSPPIIFSSHGWGQTTFDRTVNWRIYGKPVAGGVSEVVPRLNFDFSIAGGAYADTGFYIERDRFGTFTLYSPPIVTGGLSGLSALSVTKTNGGNSTETFTVSGASYFLTSGTNNGVLVSLGSAPTSGTHAYNGFSYTGTINQTGGANGITRGFYNNPTLTAAADYRAIESTNGKVLLTDTFSAGSGALAGSLLDLRQTWNTSGSPTALLLNVTNTASGASANLMDLQVGGVSRVKIDKVGALLFGTNAVGMYASSAGGSNPNGPDLLFRSYRTSASGGDNYFFLPTLTNNATSGTVNGINNASSFAPSSGTGIFNAFNFSSTINQTGGASGITRGLYINPTLTSAFDFRAIEVTGGKIVYSSTITAAGTTGAQTINKISGKVNAAAASTSLVVTNSLVTTSSIVMCQLGTNDATCDIKSVVEAAGSFTINYTAPTAETVIKFTVIN